MSGVYGENETEMASEKNCFDFSSDHTCGIQLVGESNNWSPKRPRNEGGWDIRWIRRFILFSEIFFFCVVSLERGVKRRKRNEKEKKKE